MKSYMRNSVISFLNSLNFPAEREMKDYIKLLDSGKPPPNPN